MNCWMMPVTPLGKLFLKVKYEITQPPTLLALKLQKLATQSETKSGKELGLLDQVLRLQGRKLGSSLVRVKIKQKKDWKKQKKEPKLRARKSVKLQTPSVQKQKREFKPQADQ